MTECGWCDNPGDARSMIETDDFGPVHAECAIDLPRPDGADDSDAAYEIGQDALLGVG